MTHSEGSKIAATMGRPVAGQPIVVRGTKYRVHEYLNAAYLLRLFPAKKPTHMLTGGSYTWEKRVGVWRVAGAFKLRKLDAPGKPTGKRAAAAPAKKPKPEPSLHYVWKAADHGPCASCHQMLMRDADEICKGCSDADTTRVSMTRQDVQRRKEPKCCCAECRCNLDERDRKAFAFDYPANRTRECGHRQCGYCEREHPDRCGQCDPARPLTRSEIIAYLVRMYSNTEGELARARTMTRDAAIEYLRRSWQQSQGGRCGPHMPRIQAWGPKVQFWDATSEQFYEGARKPDLEITMAELARLTVDAFDEKRIDATTTQPRLL